MSTKAFDQIVATRLARDGEMCLWLMDGRMVKANLGRAVFRRTSAVAACIHIPLASLLHIATTRGDEILVDLPAPTDLSPVHGRPTIYLDQNHWSTITSVIHHPGRITNTAEVTAAMQLVELARRRRVLLPISSAHMSETCKQQDGTERYHRALVLAQLSAGWQLMDPLAIRTAELRQALALHGGERIERLKAVTLAPNAIHANAEVSLHDIADDLPADARWAVHAIRCAGGNLDAMLDEEHLPMPELPAWAAHHQKFATFLADNPTGPELKRRRTYVFFLADLQGELAEAAAHTGTATDRLSSWLLERGESGIRLMPAVGLFREVLHEKLCATRLRWHQNDLIDMLYLTSASGYCDYVVGERAHVSHMRNGLRRLGRPINVYPNLRSLMAQLEACA